MTPENIALVKTSWQQVLPIQKAAAELFYGRLFELDPSLRPLFRGDMAEQGRKLMTMINTVVMSLDRLGPMLGAIEDLGRRHVAYGVTEAHYDTVGSALIWTLGKGLGEQFTSAVQAAWAEAYTTLASAMKQAATAAA
ncbi:MAG: hemin receptor [Thiobacillus sp. SCN 63-57]|uniref:globin family protein n=1 Tax=Thiobacillus sp. SCN 63-57 TaxID=1660145 RepID=UPI00086A54EC|nr:globin family protein [Thiobacillus sp. SCN 63-57]ODV01118.1 MAG: hemin receptor [Thiobacillus sp. SCN 63-57]